MLTILPSSSTRAILLTSLAIYSCIPLKAIRYYIIIEKLYIGYNYHWMNNINVNKAIIVVF